MRAGFTGQIPFALVTGLAAALVFLPFAITGMADPVHRANSIGSEVAAFFCGFVAAWLVWRVAVRMGAATPRMGVIVGIVTSLVVHVLLSFAVVLPAGIDLGTPVVAGLVFAWSLVLVGWLSIPLGAVVGWWMMRRLQGRTDAG